MTVADLIAQLQELAAAGWGEATVIVRNPETESHYESDRYVSGACACPEYVNQPHVLIQ